MALDTFNPCLFVSAGEQSNKFLTPAYSGGIASFQAQRAQSLTGLTVRFDPIQEGTGDPAPDNIRPISGRTGMTVTACGVNVWDEEWRLGTYNSTTGEYVQNTTNLCSKNDISVKPNTSYYFCTPKAMYIFEYAADGSFLGYTTILNNVYTTKANTAFIRFSLLAGYGTTYANDISINCPSTATTYHAYTGHTYPITWETEAGTVYGGTLDVISGVLTVTHAYWKKNTATMDNIEDYPGWKDSGVRTIVGGNSSITYRTLVGSVGSTIGVNTKNNMDVAFLPKNAYNNRTQTQWKALAIDVEFLLPLATPQTYQLSPTDVKTLAGYNQIYSDAGPVIDINF